MAAFLVLAALAAPPIFADRDVAYGDHRLQTVDVYSSLAGSGRPVMVVVHGGGWKIGDKKSAADKAAPLAGEGGFVLASVNYRLVPEVGWRDQAADVAAAVAKVRSAAADYGGNPDRVFLVGHSAGAHLAALVATDPRYLKPHGLRPGDLSGAILLDGAGYDVAAQAEAAGPTAKRLYREVFGDDAAELRAASPLTHAASPGSPPMLIAYVSDRAASEAQAKRLADTLSEAGGRARVLSVDGTHSSIYRNFGHAGDPVFPAAREFFGRPE